MKKTAFFGRNTITNFGVRSEGHEVAPKEKGTRRDMSASRTLVKVLRAWHQETDGGSVFAFLQSYGLQTRQ